MKKKIQQTILTCIVLMASASAIADDVLECPETTRLASGTVSPDSIPAISQALVSNEIVRLSGVSVFDGPPEQGASLKPDTVANKGRDIIWKFEGDYPQGKFISCDYANGLIRIYSKIADVTVACVSKTEITKSQKILKATFICK